MAFGRQRSVQFARLNSVTASQGMSLLEITVTILLASMVVLMVASVYSISTRQLIRAQNTATLIDAQSFGINAAAQNMRLAGLGLMHQLQPRGILIDVQQIPNLKHQYNKSAITPKLLSRRLHTKSSNTNVPSDQLTLSYVAPVDMWNCEGEMVLGPRQVRLKNGEIRTIAGQVVIERYFIEHRKDEGLVFVCDAAKYVTEDIERDGTRNKKGISGTYKAAIIDSEVTTKGSAKRKNELEGVGQGDIILSNVDGFWVRLMVQTEAGIVFSTIEEYQWQWRDLPVVALKIAVLHHGHLANSSPASTQFELFGQPLELLKRNEQFVYQLSQMDVALTNATLGAL